MGRIFYGVGLALIATLAAFESAGDTGSPSAGAIQSNPEAPSDNIVTVNGLAVTEQDLAIELEAQQKIPSNVDTATRKRTLEMIVGRKLIAASTDADWVDLAPHVALPNRREREIEMAQIYVKQVRAAIPAPCDAEILGFIASNPAAFGQRRFWQLDQIVFSSDQTDVAALIRMLAPDHTLDAVAARLTGLGLKFARQRVELDTSLVPPKLAGTIAHLSAGEPFVLPNGQTTTINVVTATRPAARIGPAARETAARALVQRRLTVLLNDRLSALRRSATIVYAPGYRPDEAAQKAH